MKDCIGRPLAIGDRVGVAFSYSRASVGWIKVGIIHQLEPDLRMEWEDGKVSPPMVFNEKRMVKL